MGKREEIHPLCGYIYTSSFLWKNGKLLSAQDITLTQRERIQFVSIT